MAQLCFIKLSPYSACQGKRYRTILALRFPKDKKNHFLKGEKKKFYFGNLYREVPQVLVNPQADAEALLCPSFPTE